MADDQVLVRVRAAGVNPADWAVMSGLPYVARPVYGLRKPKNPVRGTDVAGQVEAVGTSVTRFRPGDEVFGWCVGAYAEYAPVSEDALAPKPPNLTFEQAASVPMAGLVALQALRDQGNVQAGQSVLINGASGGVGTFAVQIAKVLGADVTGVCSTGNGDLVRSIGADHVIDYTKDDFTQGELRFDLILDNVASHSFAEYRRVLEPGGTLVPNSGHAGMGYVVNAFLLSLVVRQQGRPFVSTPNQNDLTTLKELIESG